MLKEIVFKLAHSFLFIYATAHIDQETEISQLKPFSPARRARGRATRAGIHDFRKNLFSFILVTTHSREKYPLCLDISNSFKV